MYRAFVILLLLSFCSHCTVSTSPGKANLTAASTEQQNAPIRYCGRLFEQTEKSIAAAGVTDSEAARIEGWPYLRINRFLSSFRNQVGDASFEAWVDQLQTLAMEGLKVEIQNLPSKARQILKSMADRQVSAKTTLSDSLQECSRIMRKADLDEAFERETLKKKAVVPSEYRLWQQIAGIYPLTAPVFRFGIKNWHDETLAIYRQPLEQLRKAGRLIRYAPEQKVLPLFLEVAEIIKRSSANPLNIPLPTPDQQQRLFERFAPIFEIDTVSDYDRIGAPIWQALDKPVLVLSEATVYRHLSHTRVNRQIFLQLNYTIWFSQRPKTSAIDLLGGQLDGITWRVTLMPDGKPWLFDAIHNCGCYHLFFPSAFAQKTEPAFMFSEPAFTPQQPLTLDEGERTIIRIASGSHYIERLYRSAAMIERADRYHLAEANNLRSLPLADGNHRSLFGPDGLVSGTERSERFLFWPMGIPNPGAMRQWGHHATAFVGRRHFDDPHLLANSFTLVEPDSQ